MVLPFRSLNDCKNFMNEREMLRFMLSISIPWIISVAGFWSSFQQSAGQLFGVWFCWLCRMAAGCCGTKKQKLNNSSSIPSYNGTSVVSNGISNGLGMVALPEMCFFCFDVLYCHLYNLAPPKTPSFSNDA